MRKVEDDIIEEINAKYPVSIQSIKQLTNEMYLCNGKDNRYYARITNYKTYEEQVEEVSWTNYLFESGVGVAPVVQSFRNNLVEESNLQGGKLIVLYVAAPGIHLPSSKWNATIFKQLGKQIGKMHRMTKEYEKRNPIQHLKDWYENEEYQFLKYIPEHETTIRELGQRILTEIKKIPRDLDCYGLLHGDVWLENVLVTENSEVTLIDFQDCEKHYYLYDLVVPLYSALEYSFSGNENIKDYGRLITSSLFEGYFEENSIPKEMLERLPLFLKLKEIFEYNLMHMYWKIDELSEEQIRILNHYRIRLENNYHALHFDVNDLLCSGRSDE